MPGCREAKCFYDHFKETFEKLQKQGADFRLLGLWADTSQEDSNALAVVPDNYVYKIDLSQPPLLLRGPENARTSLLPNQETLLGAHDE